MINWAEHPTVDKTRPAGIRFRVACFAVFALVVSSCTHGRLPEIPQDQWKTASRWPPPPVSTRIVRVGQVAKPADIVEKRGLASSVARVVGGENEGNHLVRPMDVAVGPEGMLYVVDPGVPALIVFDTRRGKTSFVTKVGDHVLVSPVGVALRGDNEVLVTDSELGAVFRFDHEGDYLGKFGQGNLKRPTGIAYDHKNKKLYVVDTTAHQVMVFGANGKVLSAIGQRGERAGRLNYPVFIAVAPKGDIWVVDSLNGRVQNFGPDGKYLGKLGEHGDGSGQFSRPKGVAIDSEGHLYVVDSIFDNVQVFSAQGQLLTYFCTGGSGDGELSMPAGITIDNQDRIFVADSFNGRIQIFRYVENWSPQ